MYVCINKTPLYKNSCGKEKLAKMNKLWNKIGGQGL